MHQGIMQECFPHGIHVHELSDTSHTFLPDLRCQRVSHNTAIHAPVQVGVVEAPLQ